MILFFDIDETLVNQREAEAAAAVELLTAYGRLLDRPYSATEFCRRWRFLREKHLPAFFAERMSAQEQRRRRIRELFAELGRTLSDTEADRLCEFYETHYRQNWELFDDVLPLFHSLSGYSLGIISNGSSKQQRLKLKRTGIEHYFDVIAVSDEIGVAKPHRDIFIAACQLGGSPPHQCIYVGDRLYEDALASRAAGMRSFWLDRSQTGSHPKIELIGSLNDLAGKLEHRIAV
jgi:putative hydrolase of the HAD superfamily